MATQIQTADIADAQITDAKLAGSISGGKFAASPALTGTPTAPTAAAGTNTTQLATTAFVHGAVADLVNSSPAALDTLKELADALGDDANFSTTITTALAGKAAVATTLAGYGITDAYTKTASDALYVPLGRTVNGHALSANVTVSAADLGLGSVENTALSTWAGSSNITTVAPNIALTTPVVDGWTPLNQAADQDVTNLTNQDSTNLQFAVTSGKIYQLRGEVSVAGNDTNGCTVRFAISTGTFDGGGAAQSVSTAGAVQNILLSAVGAANTGSISSRTSSDVTIPVAVTFGFSFKAGATGTVKLQFGNVAATGGRTSRLMAGSWLEYKKLN